MFLYLTILAERGWNASGRALISYPREPRPRTAYWR